MEDSAFVDVAQALDDLLEEYSGLTFLKLLPLPHVVEQVATGAELHGEDHVALRLERLVELHDTLVPQAEKDAHLVHDFRLLLLVAHELLVDALQCHELA